MANATIYFTFPIAIFKSGFQDIKTAINDAMDYAGYAITTKLEYNSDEQKMKAAGKQLCITFGNVMRAFQNGQKVYSKYHGTPMTSVSSEILFDYYKNDKTEFQIACLLGFAAVRSILQTKSYCKTNKMLIHARIFGYASTKMMPNELSEIEIKYAKRWHIDKVLKNLEHNWGLKTYSNHSRGLYIGFDKVDYETLALLNEEKKIKVKEARLKEIKKAALASAKQKIASKPKS